jgi:dihydroorotase
MSDFVLSQATLPNGSVADIKVSDGVIVEIGSQLQAGETIDCSGLNLLPGLVDLHTHLREPGFEQSETVLTGSQSASMGGFTAVHAMANTNPVADNAAVVEQVWSLGKRAGYVDVFPIGAVTTGLGGEKLAELGSMHRSLANVKVFSDDGRCVSDPLIMRRALEYVKAFDGVIAQHAQEPRLTEGAQMNAGSLSDELGLAGWPAVAEESIIARDVLLAQSVGARLHICHLSTKGSVEIVRWAKAQGIAVTAEVTPHHLLLTEELVKGYDPVYKVNPPLRTEDDVMALREALIDGTIDIIATDHAPHPSESKDCEWSAAAFGMVGLETAASIAQLVLIDSGRSTWQRVAEVLSHAPARIAGDEQHGQEIKVGSPANLTLIDSTAVRQISSQTTSKSQNNPYAKLELPGAVKHTIFKGYFTVRDGQLAAKGRD